MSAMLAGSLSLSASAFAVNKCLASSEVYNSTTPWAIKRMAPGQAWLFGRGAGVTIAIIGSGVDAAHGQFAPGQVAAGRNFLGAGSADNDCDGTGTAIAGLIGAQPNPNTSFYGIAPEATLLPIRVFQATASGVEPPKAAQTAQAITYAVEQGAKVVVIYEATDRDSPELASAVKAAVAEDVLVIAGGRSDSVAETLSSDSLGSESGGSDSQGETDSSESDLYPCLYNGVLGVAAVTEDNQVLTGSCAGKGVDLAAPGGDLVTTAAGTKGDVRHLKVAQDNPGAATGYVAGAAAVLWSSQPELTASEVAERLLRTADLPESGKRDNSHGWGTVNLMAAVTTLPLSEQVSTSTGVFRAQPPTTSSPLSKVTLVGISLLIGSLALAAAGAAVTRAHRRGWQPGTRGSSAEELVSPQKDVRQHTRGNASSTRAVRGP
jgi:membrane-anchored mycosin MYCP